VKLLSSSKSSKVRQKLSQFVFEKNSLFKSNYSKTFLYSGYQFTCFYSKFIISIKENFVNVFLNDGVLIKI
jgi:hypothetical protein